MAIWQYLLEHDNGITNFHFEISSDLLDDDELALMKQMRPGLIQLEIGVQTTNLVVVKEIRRTMDLDKGGAPCGAGQHLWQHPSASRPDCGASV